MSHAKGEVKFNDGTILYCEYNGTVDIMQPKLFNTAEELTSNWRTEDWPYHNKECNQAEEVEIACNYGDGFSWQGKACRQCLVLVDGFNPDFDNLLEDTEPDWFKQN